MNRYVIIGGGIAALGCIDALIGADDECSITVVSEENTTPYARPLISYYLQGKTDFDKMQYRTADFYEKNNIEFLTGETAVSIDGKTVVCKSGRKIEFDKLLAATGSSPFVPPFKGLEKVKNKFTFMTEQDALDIEQATDGDSDVLIIGAGLIGLKCAEGLRAKAGHITVCDLADRVLPSILDSDCAAIVQQKLEDAGIELMLGDSAEEFSETGALMKSGKKVHFDVLVLAVGVRPNLSLLESIGAQIGRGVIVNDKCETSVPDVYAAGDITESRDISSGENKVMAILPNAYMEGYCAGVNMSGGDSSFDNRIPMNSIGFFGYHIMTAGSYADGDMYEQRDGDSVKRLFTKDNRLVGFMLLGNVERAGIYTSLVRNSTPLDTVDFEKLKINPSLLGFSDKYRRKNLGGVL